MTDIIQGSVRETTIAGAEPMLVASSSTNTDWPAIFAGAAIASAISLVLATFGAAIGLSLASPYTGVSPATHYVALTLWVLWVTIVSFAAGGYVCGRLRHRNGEATSDEIDMRDGAHGLVVWAISTLLFVGLASASLYQVAKGGAGAGATVLTQAATIPARTEPGGLAMTNPVDRRVDELLRNATAPQGGASIDEGSRQIVMRVFADGVITGEVSNEDRGYLAELIAARNGFSQLEAQRRVDTVVENIRQDHEKAKAAANEARKLGILLSFVAAAAMLIGASSAWGGAALGGRHRDENVGFGFITRW